MSQDPSATPSRVVPLSGIGSTGTMATATLTVVGSAYAGVARFRYTTPAGEWHPHDQATTQPLGTIEVGSIALIVLVYASLGLIRRHHWRAAVELIPAEHRGPWQTSF